MSAIDELIEFMRGLEADHLPDGWPAVRMSQITALCDHVDQLRARVSELEQSTAKIKAEAIREAAEAACGDAGLATAGELFAHAEFIEGQGNG